jgi:hypothetical protein
LTAPEDASVIEPPDSETRGPRMGPCDIEDTGPLSMLRVLISLTGPEPTGPPLVSPSVSDPSCIGRLSAPTLVLMSERMCAPSPALIVSSGCRT